MAGALNYCRKGAIQMVIIIILLLISLQLLFISMISISVFWFSRDDMINQFQFVSNSLIFTMYFVVL